MASLWLIQEEQARAFRAAKEKGEMNTPTPAQALGDIGHWMCKYSDDGRYMNLNGPSSRQCFEVGKKLIKHGQHFAGLEARVAGLERMLVISNADREAAEARFAELFEKYSATVTKYDDAADKLLAMQDRAHRAEARCAELFAKAHTEQARAREAEGLLREMSDNHGGHVNCDNKNPNGIDGDCYCGWLLLKDRIAAFLAASGSVHPVQPS